MLILDGGLASQLQSQGFVVEGDPLWSSRALLSQSGINALIDAHRSFLEAGADIITTASYQCNVQNLKETLSITEGESRRVIMSSIEVARKACTLYGKNDDKPTFVAASIGPYGACLHNGSEYRGDYVDTMTVSELKDWHRPRFLACLETNCDFLAIETIPALKEAQALLELLHELAPDRQAWISFSCKDEKHTCHGELFGLAAKYCWENKTRGLKAIGINCTAPQNITPLLESCRDLGARFIVYPNSGEDWDPIKGWSGTNATSTFSECVSSWCKFDIFAVGGCCRVSPKDIGVLRRLLEH